MALLRPQYGHTRLENKDFQWQEPTDDLFDSFINPESFHNANGVGQRNYSNDFIDFFETHKASSSGSDSLDVSTIPDVEHHTWHGQQFSSFDQDDEDAQLNERFGRHLNLYSRHASRSETDLIVLPTDDVEEESNYSHAVTAPSTPRWRTKTRRPLDSPGTPLTVRKRQSSTSPSKNGSAKIEKNQQRRVTTMRRMSPHKASQSGTSAQLTKKFRDAAAAGDLEVRIPMSTYRIATPPPSTQMRSNSFDWDHDHDQAVHSPGLFVDDDLIDPVLSPTTTASSHGYSRVRHDNTPAETPDDFSHGLVLSKSLRRPGMQNSIERAAAEPHHVPRLSMSSYESPPLEQDADDFALTPPSTEPMGSAPWSTDNDPFMHGVSDPTIAGKAEIEEWGYTGVDPTQVTCGAPAANIATSNGGFGLGISCSAAGEELGVGLGVHSPGKRNGTPHHSMMPGQQHGMPRRDRPLSGDYSSHVIPTGLSPQQSMYPMSPLLDVNRHHQLSYTLSTPPRQQALPQYSPTPAQMQARQTYRPSHQRSHTVGAPITSIPPSMLTRPAYANMSFASLPSPSPPPAQSKIRSPNRRSAQISPSHKQRSKSAHHNRRKSTGATHTRQSSTSGSSSSNVGFVNFTPQDSRKILTGVAPSGSSKTKARREKEAADKRKKLSEAAKKAVLQAGGDLEALEREVLALGED